MALSRLDALRSRTVFIGGLLLLCLAATAWAYPKPATVPFRWQLEFEPGELRLYTDPIDGEHYWFFTYVITNNTGRDQLWAPTFVLFTDEGDILSASEKVSTRIESDIRTLIGNDQLELLTDIIGDVFQGREHARDGLIVWRAAGTEVTEASMFIGGLSGETHRLMHPISGEGLILRKTLQRNYLIPGDPVARGYEPIDLVSEQWILR